MDEAETELPTLDRFKLDVVENINNSGTGYMGGFKYRWLVTDVQTDIIQKVGYGMTIMQSQDQGRRYMAKLVEGKRRVIV